MASVGAMGMVWGALGGTGGGGGRPDLSSCPGEPEEYVDSPAWARQPVPRLDSVPPARDSSGFCSQDNGGVGALLRRVTVPMCSEHWTGENCSVLRTKPLENLRPAF